MNRSPLQPVVLLSIASCMPLTLVKGQDYFPPPDSEGGWRTLTDARQIREIGGMDLNRLDEAFEVCQRGTQHGGLLVVRHGYLIYEKYFGRGNREANPDMASVGKAYTSIASGIMLNEYRAAIPEGLEQKVFTKHYLPEAFPLDDPRKAEIKLGQLLSMSAGLHGEGNNPGFVNGEPRALAAISRSGDKLDLDSTALHTPLWTAPGEGYSYASASPHIASIVMRHVTGMELQEYIQEKLGKPTGWGQWAYCLHRGEMTMPHANGGGSIAVHSTDALRFGYLLLHGGLWAGKQLVPAEYVAMCGKPSPYNVHSPFSLMFEVNKDGHVAGAPGDAFFKSGGGGFGIYVIPSLDMVIYKMGGNEDAYRASLTGLPQTYNYNGSRDNWKPAPRTQFSNGAEGGDDGVRRVLEMVVAAVAECK